MWRHFAIPMFLLVCISCTPTPNTAQKILPGAYQLSEYLPMIKDKKVGLFVNHTSIVEKTHLTDTLLAQGIAISKVFSPEHGFTGQKPDGEIIEDESSNEFELISLYGNSKKATPSQVEDLDVLIIDIQDVGVRCYTYVSTMTYLMDACAQAGVPVMVLDRPNPNGSYTDGPIMEEKFTSFIGLHPVPLVHGMTLGELALMINGEKWLESGKSCELSIVKVKNWSYSDPYSLPIPPSPNLPNDLAISLYPSIVLFEGTVVSVGRGTDFPFQVIGHPKFDLGSFSFTPAPNAGSKYPPLEGEQCFGTSFQGSTPQYALDLNLLMSYHRALKDSIEDSFFNDYFKKLAGTDRLSHQIEEAWTEEQIRESWAPDLNAFKLRREQYLLYQ